MALSNELVSQFVQVTDPTNIKKDATIYGTVDIKEGKKYVKIDGSETLTPVITTSRLNQNDRVIVDIKNHNAVVIGNVSDPSIGIKVVDQEIMGYDSTLDQSTIFNKLTNYGQMHGLYMYKNNLYINASYIRSGSIDADLVSAGVLQSRDAGRSFKLDLDTGHLVWANGQNSLTANENGITVSGNIEATSGNIGVWDISNDKWRYLLSHNTYNGEELYTVLAPAGTPGMGRTAAVFLTGGRPDTANGGYRRYPFSVGAYGDMYVPTIHTGNFGSDPDDPWYRCIIDGNGNMKTSGWISCGGFGTAGNLVIRDTGTIVSDLNSSGSHILECLDTTSKPWFTLTPTGISVWMHDNVYKEINFKQLANMM